MILDDKEKVEILDEAQPEPRPVKLRGRDGKVRDYLVCDMGDEGLGFWMSRQYQVWSNTPKGAEGRSSLDATAFRDLHSRLISYCLWRAGDGRPLERVPVEEIQSWPSKTLSRLFSICQEVNGLKEEGVAAQEGKDSAPAPNSGGGTESSSTSGAG
jgi:hypothetical protein